MHIIEMRGLHCKTPNTHGLGPEVWRILTRSLCQAAVTELHRLLKDVCATLQIG